MMHEYIVFYTGDAIFIVDDHQKICGSSSFNFHGSMPQSLPCLLSVVLCMYLHTWSYFQTYHPVQFILCNITIHDHMFSEVY